MKITVNISECKIKKSIQRTYALTKELACLMRLFQLNLRHLAILYVFIFLYVQINFQ